MQGSIYDWVRYHRLHHQTFKTSDDPYYSEKDFLHAQVFAHIRNLSEKQEYLLKQVDMNDLEEDQIVMFQKRYALCSQVTHNYDDLSSHLNVFFVCFIFADSIGFSTSFSLYCCQSTHHWNIGTIQFKRHFSLRSHCAIWSYWMCRGWSRRPTMYGAWTKNTSHPTRIWYSWWPKAIGHNIIIYCRSTIKRANLEIMVSEIYCLIGRARISLIYM